MIKRHTLLWLYTNNHEIQFLSKEEDKYIINSWIKNKNPFIVTNQSSINKDKTDVGFMLPLALNKRKINFTIYNKSIIKNKSSTKLDDILHTLDVNWQKPLKELIRDFSEIKIDLFVYGSSLWQYIIEQKYMSEKSDIDLLWKPKSLISLKKTLLILKKWMITYELNIDGEIILPNNKACSWKELLNEDKTILVKSLNKVSLELKSDFLSVLKGKSYDNVI